MIIILLLLLLLLLPPADAIAHQTLCKRNTLCTDMRWYYLIRANSIWPSVYSEPYSPGELGFKSHPGH